MQEIMDEQLLGVIQRLPFTSMVLAPSFEAIQYSSRSLKFSNRVNSPLNSRSTLPVGPLRCLTTITSALPLSSINNNLRNVFGVAMQSAEYEVRTLDGKKVSETMH